MTWRLAAALDQLRAEVRSRWPGTVVWTIGDSAHAARASDHNPNAAGVVCAIDVVGQDQARAVWTHVIATRDPRVAYAIHAGQIVSSTVSPWTVRRYRGSNPHNNHTHVSVGRGPDGAKARADLYDDDAHWHFDTKDDGMGWFRNRWPSWAHGQLEPLARAGVITEHTDPNERLGDVTVVRALVLVLRIARYMAGKQ